MAKRNRLSASSGLRDTEVRREPKIVPIPIPTPASAIVEIEAPISLAATTIKKINKESINLNLKAINLKIELNNIYKLNSA